MFWLYHVCSTALCGKLLCANRALGIQSSRDIFDQNCDLSSNCICSGRCYNLDKFSLTLLKLSQFSPKNTFNLKCLSQGSWSPPPKGSWSPPPKGSWTPPPKGSWSPPPKGQWTPPPKGSNSS